MYAFFADTPGAAYSDWCSEHRWSVAHALGRGSRVQDICTDANHRAMAGDFTVEAPWHRSELVRGDWVGLVPQTPAFGFCSAAVYWSCVRSVAARSEVPAR